MIDVTPFWVGEVRWSDAVIETTTGGKGLNKSGMRYKARSSDFSPADLSLATITLAAVTSWKTQLWDHTLLRLPRQTQGVIQAFNFLRKGTKWQKFFKRET